MTTENGTPMDDRAAMEQRIQAYLDGALTLAEEKEVEAMLDSSMEAQRMLERLTRETDGLRALFDAEAAAMADAQPIDLNVSAAQARAAPIQLGWTRWPGLPSWAAPSGLAAAAGLAAGLFLASGPATQVAETPAAPGWKMSAAVYHRLYDAETFQTAPVDAEGLSKGLATLAESLDLDLAALPTPEGLTLQRAQLLRFNGRPLAQIAFLDKDGVALALCVMARRGDQPPAADAPSFADLKLLDLNAVDWSRGDHDFLLLGAAPTEELKAYARLFAQLG